VLRRTGLPTGPLCRDRLNADRLAVEEPEFYHGDAPHVARWIVPRLLGLGAALSVSATGRVMMGQGFLVFLALILIQPEPAQETVQETVRAPDLVQREADRLGVPRPPFALIQIKGLKKKDAKRGDNRASSLVNEKCLTR
jgi:hypothetical protein